MVRHRAGRRLLVGVGVVNRPAPYIEPIITMDPCPCARRRDLRRPGQQESTPSRSSGASLNCSAVTDRQSTPIPAMAVVHQHVDLARLGDGGSQTHPGTDASPSRLIHRHRAVRGPARSAATPRRRPWPCQFSDCSPPRSHSGPRPMPSLPHEPRVARRTGNEGNAATPAG